MEFSNPEIQEFVERKKDLLEMKKKQIDQKLSEKINTIELIDLEDLERALSTDFALDTIENMAINLIISNKSSAKQAVSMALQTRKIRKAISEKKDDLLKPLKNFQKNVCNHTAYLIEKLENLEESLTKKIENWIEIQNENPFDHIEKIDTEDGTMLYKYDFDFEIQNINQVPFQFLKIDEKAIENAIKNGIRNIPGLSIFETKKATFRVKNFENKVKNQSNYIDLEV